MSGEYISVSNGKRPVSNIKKRTKMFAFCAWMQIAVTCTSPILNNNFTMGVDQVTYFPTLQSLIILYK
jgi:hypothetical protein